MFSATEATCNNKIPVTLQDRVKEKLHAMVRQGILEPVLQVGVTYASPVNWQQKTGALKVHTNVNVKVHTNGKVIDEDYPFPDTETILHDNHEASYLGKID